MPSEKQLAMLREGVEKWNLWRRERSELQLDLAGADLSGASLGGIDLSEVRLTGADLSGANLTSATLVHTDLRYANLHKAILGDARLDMALLSDADLTEANLNLAQLRWSVLKEANLTRATLNSALLDESDLRDANLAHADLRNSALIRTQLAGANLTQSLTGRTVFCGVDLARAEGLETVKHWAPSTIGVDSLFLSKGAIPEAFLRGAGVPETSIEYARSLVGQAIEYHSVFISYAHEDKQFCDRLYAELQARHVRVWYFPETAKWGGDVWGDEGEIDRAIRLYDKLVVICSEHSLQSEAVLKEIELALELEEQERKRVLFPVQLDEYIFKQWDHQHKGRVLAKVVGDFRGWNLGTACYQAQFVRLLEALQDGG